MRKIMQLYQEDVRRIWKHKSALIVVIALCILPSLYAWFNIKASWDPYSENATSQIKIGIVNKDEGVNFHQKDINIGNKVIEELKKNKQLGWQFVNEKEAQQNILEGKYYAVLTFPSDFSKNITSITEDKIKKGVIEYTVNEKINAIAPKLTDKGATALQEKVSKAIVQTVSNVIFETGKEFGITLESQLPLLDKVKVALQEAQKKIGDANTFLNTTQQGVEKINAFSKHIEAILPQASSILSNSKDVMLQIQKFMETSSSSFHNYAPTIKQDILLISEISKDVEATTETMIQVIETNKDQLLQMVENLSKKLTSLQKMNKSLIRTLELIYKLNPNPQLKATIEQLKVVNQEIVKITEYLHQVNPDNLNASIEKLQHIKELSHRVQAASNQIYQSFDSVIVPSIEGLFDKSTTITKDSLQLVNEVEARIPEIKEILTLISSSASQGEKGIDYVKKKIPHIDAILKEMIEKLTYLQSQPELKQIIEFLKNDVEQRSEFLSNPIEIKENKLFPIANYGTGMTPFYTVLSLWVGLLLLSSILKVEPSSECSAKEAYFSKLLLFMSVAVIQALIVGLGDLYLLKITCAHPLVFLLGCISTSIVFTFIVYSLVSVFKNVGKVLAIILLVVQVAGSGGTFPIQLTPKFFQVLNPFLPFTYSISFLRESIGGIVNQVLIRDIIAFVIYIGIGICMALLLKKGINRLMKSFVEDFEESELGE